MGYRSNTPLLEKDEFRTPPYIFKWAEKHFAANKYDIDLAATNANTQVCQYYNKSDDALQKSWHIMGREGWCNPPYSDITPWLTKASVEATHGFNTTFLIPSPNGEARDTLLFKKATAIIFIIGRISFIAPDGTERTGNNTGSVFAYFSRRLGLTPTIGWILREHMKTCIKMS